MIGNGTVSNGHSTTSSTVLGSISVLTAKHTTLTSVTSRNSSVRTSLSTRTAASVTSILAQDTARFPIPETSIAVAPSASGGHYLKARGFVCYMVALVWLILGLHVICMV